MSNKSGKPKKKSSIRDYSAKDRLVARQRKQKIAKAIKVVIILAVILFAVLLGYKLLFGKNAYSVVVGKETVCTIDKGNITADDITNTVTASLTKELGTNVLLSDVIKLEPVHAKKSEKVTVEYAVSKIKNEIDYKIEAGIITVDGKDVVILETKQEAENLLESIKGKLAGEMNADVTKCRFEQNVSTKNDYVDAEDILSFDEAYKKLTYTTEKEDIYTVKSGDTLWVIAETFKMTIEDVQALNNMTNDSLKIGQELKVKKQVPYINIVYNG